MAESKRTFQSSKMNKDFDDRLLPPGQYRDALNISVATSEDANVGAIENLKGNHLVGNQNIYGLSSASNPNAKVIGSIVDDEAGKIYYFVTGDKADGIFEYNTELDTIHTIIIESSSPPLTVVELTFTFADSISTGNVSKAGIISTSAQIGEIETITGNFGVVTSQQTKQVDVKVKVPAGYANSGEYVYGQLQLVQLPVSAPVVNTIVPSSIKDTTVTLNGSFTSDSAGVTEVGFYWMADAGGTSSVSYYSNEVTISREIGRGAILSNGFPNWSDPFSGVPKSDLLVKDSNGTTVPHSAFNYVDSPGPAPSEITFTLTDENIPPFPITVSQLSSATTLNNARTAAEIQTLGTQVVLGAVATPFSTDLTGLTSETKYAYIAYATNSTGTTIGATKTFETDVSSVTLATFSNTTAVGGTNSVTFGAQGISNGGDPGTVMYVCTSTSNTSVSALTTAANTIRNGGSVAGRSITNFTGFTEGGTTYAAVTTSPSTQLWGLIFTENSVGRNFSSVLMSATSGAANVLVSHSFGAGSISGKPSGFTGSGTIQWYTQSGVVVPGSGSLSFDVDGYVAGAWKFIKTGSTNPTASYGGVSATSSSASSRFISYSMGVSDANLTSTPQVSLSGGSLSLGNVPFPATIGNAPGITSGPNNSTTPSGVSGGSYASIPSGGFCSWNYYFLNSNEVSQFTTPYTLTNIVGSGLTGTWSHTWNGSGGTITYNDGGSPAGTYSSTLYGLRMTKYVSSARGGNTQYIYPGGTTGISVSLSAITIT